MAWEVEASDEFKGWYESLDEAERASVAENVDMLEEYGPALGRPYADTIRESRYPNMKELRVQHQGKPYRILFAFDPRRRAYLILGGDKTGTRTGMWKQFAGPKLSMLCTLKKSHESRNREALRQLVTGIPWRK
jgi:hypothetical protein